MLQFMYILGGAGLNNFINLLRKNTIFSKKRTAIFLITILVGLLLFTACANKPNTSDVHAVAPITVTNEAVGFSLLKEVTPDDEGNIFISPTSALIAMLMVYNGADGKTKEQIAEALQIEDLSDHEVNEATKALLNNLTRDEDKLELTVANSLWLNHEFSFNKTFANKMQDYFDAEIDEIDITDPTSATKINNWVEKATKGMIDEIVESPLSNDLVAYLINALYFNGTWTYEFDEQLTIEDTFFTENDELKIPFMQVKEELAYFETDELQAVQLPYNDGEMNMQLFLPKENYTLDGLVEKLDEDRWNSWQKKFSQEEGTVQLPKFKLEYETLLNEPLQQLGITDAFDTEKANLSNLIESDTPLHIDEVKQKTAIKVDEQGTEASAATSVAIEMSSANIEDEPFYMKLERPFLFTIYDEELEHIIFIGTIKNPEINE